MIDRFTTMMKRDLSADWSQDLGALDLRGNAFGIGGVHHNPPPEAVVAQTAALKPRMVRIFLQEFFYIYDKKENADGTVLGARASGLWCADGTSTLPVNADGTSTLPVFDWSRLDPYMDAVHAMGGDIMASICIKPKALYPVVDEYVWRPTDVAEWQGVVKALVLRYGKEKPYVTHWAVANETNIGEWGGCPYHIADPDDMFEYYRMTAEPIREVLPGAKVGGPSYAGGGEGAAKYLARVAELCVQNGVALDFTCYNAYCDTPEQHVAGARVIREALDRHIPGLPLYMTEFNIGICNEPSLEEKAHDPKRAASLAASIIALHDGGALAGTFQYHIYDQWCDPREFAPWYAKARYMAEHWNDIGHRLGLFDQFGAPRPQYQMYKMFYELDAGRRAALTGTDSFLRGLASRGADGTLSLLLTNFAETGASDMILQIRFANAPEGVYTLDVRRIGETQGEHRVVYVHNDFHFDVFTPANNVTLIQLRVKS